MELPEIKGAQAGLSLPAPFPLQAALTFPAGSCPDLDWKLLRSAGEWIAREDKLSSLQAAMRVPRPGSLTGAQEATHALGEAH